MALGGEKVRAGGLEVLEPVLLFDDPPVATVHSVDIADIKQRVASMIMY